MTPASEPDEISESSWRHPGWRVVLCMFALACGSWGFAFYGIGLYLVTLHDHFGWPIAEIASLITLYHLAGAGMLISVGALISRFGPRPVLIAALIAMALAVVAMSRITALWQLVPVLFLLALGWSGLSSASITAVVAPWFRVRRGVAIGLALTGASVAGILIVPGMAWAIGRFGLLIAMPLLAALLLLLLVPTVWFGLAQPAPVAQLAPGLAREAPSAWLAILGSRRFWAVTGPFLLPLVAQVGFLTHQVAILEPRLGVQAAAFAVSVSTAAALIGRIAIGAMADRLDLRGLTSVVFVAQAASLVLLAANPGDPLWLYVACAGYGLGIGNMITMPGLITHQEIPLRDLPRAIGLVFGVGQVFYAFGPALLGWVEHRSGSYSPALILAAVLILIGAVALNLTRPRMR